MSKKFLDYDGLEEVVAQVKSLLLNKEDTISLAANKAVVSNSNGGLTTSATTATELGYLSGVTSDVQTQLNAKQPILTAGENITIQDIDNVLTISASGTITLTGDVRITDLESGVYKWIATDTGANNYLYYSGNTSVEPIDFAVGERILIVSKNVQTFDGDTPIFMRTWLILSATTTQSFYDENTLLIGKTTSNSGNYRRVYMQNVIIQTATPSANQILMAQTNGGDGVWTTMDTTPTDSSVVPLTSGGAYTALSGKQDTITGGASSITSSNLTASRALVSDSNGKVAASDVTSTEIGYLDGVTSSIQTQLNGKQASLDSTQLAAVNSGIDSTLVGKITGNETEISTINSKIPSQASSTNQLADKDFVNSSIQTQTAHFRGNWTTWSAVPTSASSYPADDDGNTTPTSNDYMVVQDASGYTGETLVGTWRFKYSGVWSTNGKNGWLPEYQVNETPLTAAQLEAINSGITSTLVGQITTNQTNIGNKVDKSSTASQVYITNSSGTSTTASQGTAFNKNFETSTSNIKMDGTVSVGSSSNVARADHIHPTDTTRQATYTASSSAWDTTPTASSTKPVTSGGIYTALAGKEDTMTAITTQEIDDLFNGS